MLIGPDPPLFPGDSRQESPKTTSKLGKVAATVLADIVSVSPALDPNRVKVEETFQSAWNFEDLGDSYRCTQTMTDDQLNELNDRQFPALQRNFKEISKLLGVPGSQKAKFLKNFGIFIDPKTSTLHFPKKNTLETKLNEYRKQSPSFPQLSLLQVTEIVAPAEFLKILLENDVIFSDPPELIHDVGFHIIPLLLTIFENLEAYTPFREKIISSISRVEAELEKAKKKL